MTTVAAAPRPHFINPQLAGETFLWPAGPVGVVLSHGFTATTAEVRPLAQRLHAAGYSVAGPLLPGHGTTPEDLNTRRWPEWVAAVEAAYQALAGQCQRVFLGGESMGAMLALNVASRHPEAAGLLLYAPAIQTTARLRDIALAALASRVQPVRAKPRRAPTPVDPFWQGYDVYPTRALLQFFQLQWETRRLLPRVQPPVLIIQGRLDLTVHPLAGALIEAGIASARQELHWMERSTHCVVLDEELPRIAELTLAFLTRHAG
ncbi:MAG: alpha/beta fold hydrolase [Anaerolineales bacterium]|nr:alpha/beta fold hydrolase [Anaerolineales bacterium]